MINKIATTLALFAVCSTSAWAGDCDKPNTPTVPNGAKADMETMLEGKKAISAFQTSNSEYLGCLNKDIEAQKSKIAEGGDESDIAKAKKEFEKLTEKYNEAVDAEEQLANKFNSAIREFKQANPS